MSAADDKAATDAVLQVLADKSISQIDFPMGDISVKPSMYEKVSKAIGAKEITVMVVPEMLSAAESARYFSVFTIGNDQEWYNLIVLRTSGLGGNANEKFHAEMAIVHECTHAGFDLLKIPKMTHTQHEAGAYIAGAIFGVADMLDMKGDPSKFKDPAPIFMAAWDIALLSNSNKNAPSSYSRSPDFAVAWYSAISKLNVLIANSDEYKATAKDLVKNDGVGREWKLPKAGGGAGKSP
jgi:hypothetical protein